MGWAHTAAGPDATHPHAFSMSGPAAPWLNGQPLPSQQWYNEQWSSQTLGAQSAEKTIQPFANGSIWDVVTRLSQLGAPVDRLVTFILGLAPHSVGPFLRYLQMAALDDDEFSHERLAVHLDIALAVHPRHYELLRRFVSEVRHRMKLSPEVAHFVGDRDLESRLHGFLVSKFGSVPLAQVEPRKQRTAFLRSTLRFLENFTALTAADPNLAVLYRTVNRFGSIQAYYAEHERPRRTVRRLLELGFDVDHIVFSRDELLSLGPGEDDLRKPWAAWLRDTIQRLLGSRDEDPEIDLGLDRKKFFGVIKQDYQALLKDEDEASGLRLVNQLLSALERRQEGLLRNGDLISETSVKQIILELQAIKKKISGDAEHLPTQRLVAIRSPKLVPELLFDNTRLSCCLFKPNGLFHGEICRLILDPATPIIEFWLEPYPEFLGLATLYLGLNARGERTILMDTVDYNDLLHDLRGYNGTMRFMLDAIVANAHLAKAKRVAIIAAPWGKPLGFANFVKQMASRSEAINYQESYYFEAADPADGALDESLVGRHHYTEAYGYDSPLAGVIDYCFSLVGWGTVEKLYTGGRGVYEIDVEQYLLENETLKNKIGKSGAPVVQARKGEIFAPPAHHEDELSWRRNDAIARAEQRMSRLLADVRIERLRDPSGAIISELIEVENSAFPEELRYGREHFADRLILKDAELLLVRQQQSLVGFALSYVAPAISWQDVFLDDLAFRPDLRSKGLGSALVALRAELSAISGYRGLYVTATISPELSRFYERQNFQLVGMVQGAGQILYRPLGLLSSGDVEVLPTVLREAERLLQAQFSRPSATVHSALDQDLLQIALGLETAFPEDLRYDQDAFRERMACQDAHLLVLREQNEPIACCMCFRDPDLPRHAVMIDSLAVRPELQGRGIGRVLLKTQLTILALTGYTAAMLTCRKRSVNGVDLVAFYRSVGAKETGRSGNNVQMCIPLRANGHDPKGQDATGQDINAGHDTGFGEDQEERRSGGDFGSPPPNRHEMNGHGMNGHGSAMARSLVASRPQAEIIRGNGHANGSTNAGRGGNGAADEELGELSRLPSINRGIIEKLRKAGVHTIDDFLRSAGPREGRSALAEEVGIDVDILLQAALFADLTRTGVAPRDLGRLRRARVQTLDELRDCPTENLRRALPPEVSDADIQRFRESAIGLETIVER
ncbi:GNAT family N-acetyltransferase [Bradyrhizobium uaiense]|nr:GNAT family N-acetyltransferase [Bradyrhizobium uaiense]